VPGGLDDVVGRAADQVGDVEGQGGPAVEEEVFGPGTTGRHRLGLRSCDHDGGGGTAASREVGRPQAERSGAEHDDPIAVGDSRGLDHVEAGGRGSTQAP
jgi:hypothetical protein